MMKRALSVWMPALSVDALRRRERAANRIDTRPVLIVRDEHQRQVVVACCKRAAGAGVVPGLCAPQARALFPPGRVRLVRHDPQRDSATLRSLSRWAQRFSPVVALDKPDALLIDITGCHRLFASENNILEQVITGLARLGFDARACIAPTFACANAIARFGPPEPAIVPDGQIRKAIEKLPLAALGLDDDTVRALAEVGLDSIGQVLELPRAVLPARFGPELLLRLDQITGSAIETITPIGPCDPIKADLAFQGPTTHAQSIHKAVCVVLDDLTRQLEKRGLGALRIDLKLHRSDLEPAPLSIHLTSPTHDRDHLRALFAPKLEPVNLGFGVERVSASVPRLAPCIHEQAERWREHATRPDAEMAREAGRLIDTLINRLGNRRVCRGLLVESHIPEHAFVQTPMTGARASAGVRTPGPRPSVLLAAPIPVEVVCLSPDGPVHRLHLAGEHCTVTRCIGPERICPRWWCVNPGSKGGPAPRDYFRLELETGHWLWVCRSGSHWAIHGAW